MPSPVQVQILGHQHCLGPPQVHMPGRGQQQQDLPLHGQQQEKEERHGVSQEEDEQGEPAKITKGGYSATNLYLIVQLVMFLILTLLIY